MWRRKLCSLYDINPLLYLPSNDAATQSISTIVCICYVTCVLKSSFCTLSILLYYLALGPLAASKQRFNFIISSFHINYVWIRWAEQSSAREKDFECGKNTIQYQHSTYMCTTYIQHKRAKLDDNINNEASSMSQFHACFSFTFLCQQYCSVFFFQFI